MKEYLGFLKMNNCFDRMLKNEYLFWMNILDVWKMSICSEGVFWILHRIIRYQNRYFGFTLPASKTVVAKCLKLIWNHSGIISGTYFSPLRWSFTYTGAQEGSAAIFWPYFGLLYNFPHFVWTNNSIENSRLYWINTFFEWIFWILLELNFELNQF